MSNINIKHSSDDPSPDYESAVRQLMDQISRRNARLGWLKDEHKRLTQGITEKEQAVQALSAQVAEKEQSVQALSAQVAEKEQNLAEIRNSKAWKIALLFRRIRVLLAPPNSRRARVLRLLIVPVEKIRMDRKLKKDLALMRSSGLFDKAWYLASNPDVAKAKIDPALHYLVYGGFEGRDPSANFSSKWYFETYPDVQAAGINPLIHYLRDGKSEGRLPGSQGERQNKILLKLSDHNQDNISVHKGFASHLRRGLTVWKEEGFKKAWGKTINQVKRTNVAKYFQSKANDQVFPKVSIVIPVFNALPMTQACLSSLYRETKNIDFEIIIIDNASKDGTSKWLKAQQNEHPNLKYLHMDHNIGFGPAVNIGLQRSTGEFIVILNNDTLVAPDWLNNLLATMKADPTIGIVSPATNYVGEGPQIDEQAQNLPPDPVAIAQYAKGIAGRTETFYEPNRLVFFCVLLRRELVDLIGYLDEGYEKGNFEDDDYCLRARMAGYRLAIARNAFVYHHGTATFKLNRISHNQWMEINRGRFYRKAGRIATSSRPWRPSLSKREVSVIVRTKDRPLLLRKALTSLANQTFRDFEVMLINDGGEDVSSLVASFDTHFPITYVYHIKSKGRTAAINAGLENAKGKWIAYLDDDDILYPWHFEVLLQAAEICNAKVVYSDYNRVLFTDSNALFPSYLVGAPPWDYNHQEILVQNHLPIHTYMHLGDCIDKVGLWNEGIDMLEDYEFLLRLSSTCDFQHVRKVTCEYRYFLDTTSSISKGREGYLTSLQYIYRHHPVTDVKLSNKRQSVVDGLRLQTQQIDELLKNAGDSPAEQLAVYREIILLATGL